MALDDRAEHLQKAVHLRIEQASLRAKTRFADLPEGTAENLAKLVAQKGLIVVEVGPTGVLFQALTRCPACHTEAAALSLKAPGTALLFDLELAAEGLWCDICHLHLGSGEEVGIAGLPATSRYSAEDLIRVSDHSPTPQRTDPAAAELLAHAMRRIPGDSVCNLLPFNSAPRVRRCGSEVVPKRPLAAVWSASATVCSACLRLADLQAETEVQLRLGQGAVSGSTP